jgi:hypothetical protein
VPLGQRHELPDYRLPKPASLVVRMA